MALLQYVVNQLKSSESLDLLVLKEMVQTMTVSPTAETGPHGCRDAWYWRLGGCFCCNAMLSTGPP